MKVKIIRFDVGQKIRFKNWFENLSLKYKFQKPYYLDLIFDHLSKFNVPKFPRRGSLLTL